jgi:hypothetical protein
MTNAPLLAGVRALLAVVLLAASALCMAQSSSDAGTESNGKADTKASDSLNLNLKAPLKPADNVGGSWNWYLGGGPMANESLVHVFLFDYGGWYDDTYLISGEIGYTLKDDNPVMRFLSPVVSSVDVVANFTYQDEPGQHVFEFNPYMMARWSNFPWNNTIRTTFGLGGGLSYATPIPQIEKDSKDPDGNYKNLMHFMAVEATFSLPDHKDWQLVYRLHHRSGVFGLMQGDNAGNTAVEIGIRHYFK